MPLKVKSLNLGMLFGDLSSCSTAEEFAKALRESADYIDSRPDIFDIASFEKTTAKNIKFIETELFTECYNCGEHISLGSSDIEIAISYEKTLTAAELLDIEKRQAKARRDAAEYHAQQIEKYGWTVNRT